MEHARPDPAELWQAADDDLERVASVHGPWLLASVGMLAAAPEVTSGEQTLRALTTRLALLLPAHPHLEPFLTKLCEQPSRSRPFSVQSSMPVETLLATLRAGVALCAAAPHLARPPYLRCSELLELVLHHEVVEVRALTLRLVLDTLRLSDASRAKLFRAVAAAEDSVPLPLIVRLQPLLTQPMIRPNGAVIPCPVMPAGVACVGQELLCCLGSNSSLVEVASGPRLVPTEHSRQVLESLSIVLCSSAPVLLSGPTGSGKSALLAELASLVGQRQGLVRVHMDEQIDSKVRRP